MEPTFWHQRWNANEIGFHEGAPNALLVKHLPLLKLQKGQRVFLPLCGKTRDIHWLLAQGFQVVGAELSKLAVTQLFTDLQVEPRISVDGALTRYAIDNLDILQGDIFDITPEMLGPVDAIYDRAALVALPTPLRERYATHIMALTKTAPQMLITFAYDQSIVNGPPFSVDSPEVARLYQATYEISQLQSVDVPRGIKGKAPASETIQVLRPKKSA
ncbi:MAG: thiopurine S-methyltransferase [Rhodospirillaceae bacterium]|nr:thiopurine S-methyltransferase [Rhodospirillaceae bacterium]